MGGRSRSRGNSRCDRVTTEHQHGPATHDRAFAAGVALNIAFVVTETVFGVLAGSLALLADAAHNFSDVISLLLAWGASYLSRRARSERRTYGWRTRPFWRAW